MRLFPLGKGTKGILFPEGQLSITHRTMTVKNESNFTDTAWC